MWTIEPRMKRLLGEESQEQVCTAAAWITVCEANSRTTSPRVLGRGFNQERSSRDGGWKSVWGQSYWRP